MKMEAWRYHSALQPTSKLEDSLQLDYDIPLPDRSTLGPGDLLIQILTVALNPVDYKLPESGYMGQMMISTYPATPGLDFCGRVAEVGPPATTTEAGSITQGQLVFGSLPRSSAKGTLAQYVMAPMSCCAVLPDGVAPDQGAAVGAAATTAFQALGLGSWSSASGSSPPLKDAHIFVNGGTGGVGTWTLQLAKAMGAARVVATCSLGKADLCRQLGADEVVDYTREDVMKIFLAGDGVGGGGFYLVVDNVGADSDLYNARHRLLKPGSMFSQVGVGEGLNMMSVLTSYQRQLCSKMWGSQVSYRFINMKNDGEWFREIGTLMAEGKVRSVIDSVYPWAEVSAAYRKLRTGRAQGKIIIQVAKE